MQIKKSLQLLGIDAEIIRRVSIAMYEGEINMVIHADGGTADVTVYDDYIEIVLADTGPGIADVSLAMQAGYSTAPDNIRSLGFGAGMGLPNMQRYSDQMHIDTELGVGYDGKDAGQFIKSNVVHSCDVSIHSGAVAVWSSGWLICGES